jgi:hypothetical protein
MSLALVVAIIGLVYAPIVYLVILERDERARLRQILHNLLARRTTADR